MVHISIVDLEWKLMAVTQETFFKALTDCVANVPLLGF